MSESASPANRETWGSLTTTRISLCPASDCTALSPPLEVIGPTRAGEIGEPKLSISYRCTSCGCVWRYIAKDVNRKKILGTYKPETGWIPAGRRKG